MIILIIQYFVIGYKSLILVVSKEDNIPIKKGPEYIVM